MGAIILALMTLVVSPGACENHLPSKKVLWTYDLTHTLKMNPQDATQRRKMWDEAHFVFALQGIVNRESPRLYVFFVSSEGQTGGDIDRYWLRKLREPGEWLSDWEIREVPDLPTLVREFRKEIKGLVVYDELVPATSNVASTIAGVHGFACVRYDDSKDSLYWWLTKDPEGPKLPVKVWLVNKDGSSVFTGKGTIPGSNTPSTGSAKCDAYIWAKEKLLDTGKCNATKMGYYLDAYWLQNPSGSPQNHTLSNHDYFISKRGFFFDLSPWDDEIPIDDAGQPLGTDVKTLKAILVSAWKQTQGRQMIHVGGFLPWDKKYTTFGGGRREPVPGEWRYAEIISCFNGYMDADALSVGAMANASVFQHFPLKERYPQKLPTLEDLRAKGFVDAEGKVAPKVYIYIYVGDYDSAAWLYRHLPGFWEDAARGTIPLGWAFNPNLADRFAPGMDYTRRTKTDLDFFVAGDCGAGYLNPQYLVEPRPHSNLPSGLEVWKQHCLEYYRRWDISLTGFIIEGNTPKMSEEVRRAYNEFSSSGYIGQKFHRRWGIYEGVPFMNMGKDIGIGGPPETACNMILESIGGDKPAFYSFRTILWSPTNIKKLYELLEASPEGKDIEIVDPYTLMLLIKQHESPVSGG